ncbi:hypothetical protein [Paenibacillus sp.]|uniref:hypothetical protein n=1 Tax=Paenibacillus sp. TaxID=58172 RepID=UPI002D2D8E54|nr:hypothetical protein [Paenibacillus sp.]HZG57637.1 hypothetical protein [Paenibacillus sp.]
MFEALFPGGGLDGAAGALERWFWPIAVAAVLYGAWRSHWRSRYARRMRQTFEVANLFVKPKKDKLFPQLLTLTATEDDLFYVFRYRLRPGMSVPQFEEKKKIIEAAFHAETKVFGKGGVVTIKVKKQPHPLSPTETSGS